MGSGSSKVTLNADAASTFEPGQKCIVSEAFDEYATAEEFFDMLLEWFKDVRSPIDGSAPKGLQVVDEVQGKEFTTLATWDGDGCRKASYIYTIHNCPKTGDYVTKKKVVYDKSSLTITDINSSGGTEKQQHVMTATGRILKNPARFEWFSIDKDGVRHSDKAAAKDLQAVMDDVFTRLEKSKAPAGGA